MKTNNWPRHPEINPTLKSSSFALTYLQQIADAGLPLCAALERAHEKGWHAVSIKTDSAASIYNIATGKKDYPVVHKIEQLMNTLDVHIEWLDRDYNSIANGLARMALGLKSPALPGVSYSKLVKAISSWSPQASVYDQTPRSPLH